MRLNNGKITREHCLETSIWNLRIILSGLMQELQCKKNSASTLQKSKITANELHATVTELKNAVRVFNQLSAASSYHSHGINEKKMRTHEKYCKHLLDAAKVHCEAVEREEQHNHLKLEDNRRYSLAEEARRKSNEQRKYQLKRRKKEDELKRAIRQKENFERIKEQWKNYINTSRGKRKDRPQFKDDHGGNRERKIRKGGKRRKKNKKDYYEQKADIEDEL
ncbi:protein CTR9 homolog [Dendrobium catenatum]|uniref:protein CTR9 homolog n=1 Tax=Dendrobium catenatum TaxID=906689 RepID=UPI0009F272F0|nr:protein CTR9 homolog [Dendrobium catenatum]